LASSDTPNSQLRLRVFAGPNGSGKSTVIKSIRDTIVNGRNLDFGTYINADDIASALKEKTFSFSSFNLNPKKEQLISFANISGLISTEADLSHFTDSFDLKNQELITYPDLPPDRLAQITARYLREQLLSDNQRFSFETVFSHRSNLDIMRRAAELGYKEYLYFVSTESPEINKYRVALRVKQGGHKVPINTIEETYYRSLSLLKEAADLSYQAFFFDNSIDKEPYKLVGHFKMLGDQQNWDNIREDQISQWFRKYYLEA
jgi:predicted ABC-type ATPase